MAIRFYEQTVTRCASGFGDYQSQPIDGEGWANESDLADAMKVGAADQGAELFEVGVDTLPDGVDDIRGRIYNGPDRLFALVYPDGAVAYSGITSI